MDISPRTKTNKEKKRNQKEKNYNTEKKKIINTDHTKQGLIQVFVKGKNFLFLLKCCMTDPLFDRMCKLHDKITMKGHFYRRDYSR